jgi:hypothetical protein
MYRALSLLLQINQKDILGDKQDYESNHETKTSSKKNRSPNEHIECRHICCTYGSLCSENMLKHIRPTL